MQRTVVRDDRRNQPWSHLTRSLPKYCGTLALALAFAAAAFGQPTRPANRPMDDDFPRDRGMPDRGDRDLRRHDEGNQQNGQNDFPARELHGAVEANARTAFARAQYHRLQDSLNGAIRQMQYTFEHSAEMMDALKAEKQAWDDYMAARNAALRPVVTDPKYQANVALKNEMGDRIADVRAAYDAQKPAGDRRACELVDQSKMKQLVTLATVKLDYAQLATDMEVAALKNDTKVADARAKLMAAGSRVQAQRDNFDKTMRASQELAAIRKGIEDARVAFITSEAYRDGAVEVANEALDYSYYKNRFSSNYNSYGYPYGYGAYSYGTPIMRY